MFTEEPPRSTPAEGEARVEASGFQLPPWPLFIVDDDEDVHTITRVVLKDLEFDGRGVEFLSAYSAGEAREILTRRDDIAVILLDVVMESEHAGLELARHIREELGNRQVRIILRTGQPGSAPEREVITGYDINDYKEKSDLTAKRLFTTIVAALRSYRDIRTIHQSKQGLEQIVQAAHNLFEPQSFDRFCQGVLEQLTALWQLHGDGLYVRNSGFAARRDSAREGDGFIIHAGIGHYRDAVGAQLDQATPEAVRELIHSAAASREPLIHEHEFVSCYHAPSLGGLGGPGGDESGGESLIYLSSNRPLQEMDVELLQVFSGHVAAAFDNLSLNQEINDTQREIIFALGEVVEMRCKETGSHVRRVGEVCHRLARLAGLSEEEAELLRIAAPMHDVGKIGIPDNILNKPGRLSDEEFALMEGHTSIGYHILAKSQRRTLKAAAIIAHQHHERWDGNGYPQGLAGEDIHLYGRISAIADVFDALLHKRPYKEPWPLERIVELMREQRGRQFDPRFVDLLLEQMEQFMAIQRAFPD